MVKNSLCLLLFIVGVYSNLFCFDINEEYKKEKLTIEKDGNKALRENEKLTVLLKNGDKKTYLNIEKDGEKAVYYFFKKYYADIGFYLIETAYFEGNRLALVDEKTGKEYVEEVYNEPVISSDKKWLLFVNDDESDYTFNGVKIFAINNGNLKKVFELETKSAEYSSKKNYYVKFSKWNGNKEIELDKFDMNENKIGRQILVLENNNWKIKMK